MKKLIPFYRHFLRINIIKLTKFYEETFKQNGQEK